MVGLYLDFCLTAGKFLSDFNLDGALYQSVNNLLRNTNSHIHKFGFFSLFHSAFSYQTMYVCDQLNKFVWDCPLHSYFKILVQLLLMCLNLLCVAPSVALSSFFQELPPYVSPLPDLPHNTKFPLIYGLSCLHAKNQVSSILFLSTCCFPIGIDASCLSRSTEHLHLLSASGLQRP